MIKRLLTIIVLMAGMSIDISAFDVNLDSALNVLDQEIAIRQNYYNAKESHISSIRKRLNQSTDLESRFEFMKILFDQYQYYQSDSAFQYSRRMAELSEEANDSVFKAIANAALMNYYTSVWMLDNSRELQQQIDETLLPQKERLDYYNTCINLFFRLSDASEKTDKKASEAYIELCDEYVKKAIDYSRPGSFDYELRMINHPDSAALSPEEDIQARLALLNDFRFEDHEQAIIYASISPLAVEIGDTRLASYCNAMSAIYDIRSSTHETSAVHTLAQLMNYCDDSERAVRYIMVAFDDALFFNSRTRQSQIGSLIPMLESIRYENLSKQKRVMVVLFILASVLLIGSMFLLLKLFRKNKGLEQMKGSLNKMQDELVAANKTLSDLNEKLRETVAERNSYIMQSLYLNTDFLNLLESRCRDAINEVKAKGTDAIRFLPYQLGIKEERQRIMQRFDSTFLQVFPDFIDEFNSLLEEGCEVKLNEDGSLSTDIRIFALMRLGVTDTQEIADFLNISPNSVYVYKAKIKAKSKLSKADFDKRILMKQK